MIESRAIIANGGRIVIPSNIRKELNLKIGEEVILKVESGELHITSLKIALQNAQKLVKKYNKDNLVLSKELLKARKEESKDG